MKTVMNAVNEFEGIYFDGECGDEDHQDEVVVALKDFGDYQLGDIKIGSGNTIGNSYWGVICTREEFNQCVDEMTTNYGTSETYSDYKANYTAINDDMKLVTVPKSSIEEVTYKGMIYQMGKLYACHRTGRIGTLKSLDTIQDYPFVISYREENSTTTIPCLALVKACEAGTITEAPIKLIDGKAYQFNVEFVGTVCGVYYKGNHELNGSEGNYEPEFCANIKLLEVKS